MKFAALSLLFLLLIVVAPGAAAAAALSLDAVRLVDVERGRSSALRCVRIEAARIVAITRAGAARCRRHAQVYELSGRYLLPGLIDMHAHLTLGPLEVRREDGAVRLLALPDEAITQHNAQRLLAFGVTTIRSPAGDLAAAQRYRAQRAAGHWPGPEAYFSGPVLHDASIEGLSSVAKDVTELRRLVAAQVAAGADWIKLYTGLSAELLKAGVDAAHAHGKPAVAHLDGVPWDEALALGLDGLVHLMPTSPELLPLTARARYQPRPGSFAFFEWWEQFDPDGDEADRVIAAFDRYRPVFDATLVAFHAAFHEDDAIGAGYRAEAARYAHPRLLASWQGGFSFALGWQADDYRRARAVWPRLQRFAQRVYASRARVTIGTDMSNPWIAPGVSLHRELALLAEAGVPNARLLQAATVNAAEALGLGREIGRLRPGYQADLVVLDVDPLQDITATRALHAVLADGAFFDAAQLARWRGEAP